MELPLGYPIYYNTGELSFERDLENAGTFRGIFIESINDHVKIIDKNGKLRMMHKSLVSLFNI